MPRDQFGGVDVDEFGGVAVEDEAPDLSKIKLSPYEQAVEDRGGLKPESGMESGTELTTALARGVLSAPGRIAEGFERLTAPKPAISEYTIPKEKAPVAEPTIVAPPAPAMKTALGGPPQPMGDFETPEARRTEFFRGLQAPVVPLPKAEVKPDDSFLTSTVKELANVALSVPEFFETPLGMLTLGVGAESKVAATAIRRLFLADMFKNVITEFPQLLPSNFSKLTPAEKGKLVASIAGSSVMMGALAKAEIPKIKAPPGQVGMEAPELTGAEKIERPGELAPDIMQAGRLHWAAERQPAPLMSVAGGGAMALQPPALLPPRQGPERGASDFGDVLSGERAMVEPPPSAVRPPEAPKAPEVPKPVEPEGPPSPVLRRAREVAKMTDADFAKAFPGGFNPENYELGETATADDVAELKTHHKAILDELRPLREKIKAGKAEAQDMDHLLSLSMRAQYFLEAIQAAPKEVGGEGRIFKGAEERAKARAPKTAPEVKKAEPPKVEPTTVIDPRYVSEETEVPVDQIVINKDIKNFKEAADEKTGVVPEDKLEGKYERLGTARIVVWRKNNGELEVITGRHRLDLARRTGEKTIPAQIVDEKNGFTRDMALTFDAEANIRDEKGSLNDYAHYFRNSPTLDEATARQRGLLSSAKGKAGWHLGKNASDDLYSAWRSGKLNDAKAVAIARAAPGDQAKQQLGIKLALKGKSADYLRARLERERAKTEGPVQTDMFGNPIFDDTKDDAETKKVVAIRSRLAANIKAAKNAANDPEGARAAGIDVKDAEKTKAQILQWTKELEDWEGAWWLNPELVRQVTGKKEPPPQPPKGGANVERALEIEKEFGLSPADAHFFNVAIEAVKADPGKWTTIAEGLQKEAMRAAVAAGGSLEKTGDLKLAKRIGEKYFPKAPPPEGSKLEAGQKVFVGEPPMHREGTLVAPGPRGGWFVKTNLGEVFYEAKDIRPFEEPPSPPKPPEGPAPGSVKSFMTPEERKQAEDLEAWFKAKLSPSPGDFPPAGSGAPIDPEFFTKGSQLAMIYVKAGARKFGDFAKNVLAALGDQAKPYLLSWYNNARLQLKEIAHELDSEAEAQRQYEHHFNPTPTGRPTIPRPVGGGGTPGGRPGIRISRQELIPEPRQHVNADSYAARSGFRLDEEQVRGVNLILDRFLSAPKGGFVLADGTGFGKTAQMLAVADQYIKKFTGRGITWEDRARNFWENASSAAKENWLPGDPHHAHLSYWDELDAPRKLIVAKALGIDVAKVTASKPRVLVVTQNKQVVEMRFKGDAERMGIDPKTITLTTYTSLAKVPKGDWDLVIFDEAHNLKNSDSQKSVRAARLDSKHTLFGTATPMDRPTGAAYFLAEITGKSEQEIGKDLGYQIVQREDPITHEPYDSAVLLPGFSWPKVWANIMAHRDAAIKGGAMLRREYPFYGDVRVDPVDMSFTDKTEHDLIASHIDKLIQGSRNPTVRKNYGGQKTLQLGRWAEQAKLATAMKMALAHLEKGGQVIIVCETDKPQSFWQPVRDSVSEMRTSPTTGKTREVWVTDGAITKLKRMLAEKGITDIADIHDPKANDIALQVRNFQSGKARVALATPQSGGTGIDLDDVTGDKPRLMIALSKNMAGDSFEQLVGRVSRKNTKSPSQVVFLDLKGAYGDQRRNAILDTKIRTLKAIQGGEDIDVAGGLKQEKDEGDLLKETVRAGAEAKIAGMSPKDLSNLIAEANPENGMLYSGIPIPNLGLIWDQTKELVRDLGPEIRQQWRSFSMQSMPRTTFSDRLAGEAGARLAQVPMVARAIGEQFAARVTEGARGRDFDLKFGTGLNEDNLRDLKRIWNERADEAENREEIISDLKEQAAELRDDARDGDPAAVAALKQIRREISRLKQLTDEDVAIFRDIADKVTTTIGADNSPFPNEAAYRAFMESPEAQEALRKHIRLWESEKDPLYRQSVDLDPDVELATRGLDYGARVNLKNLNREEITRTSVGPNVSNPLIRATATLKKFNPHQLAAKGAGTYEGSYKEIMVNGFEIDYRIAKQHEFIRTLLEAGDASVSKKEFVPGLTIKGEETKGYPLKYGPYAKQFLQIRKSLAPEYEDASGLSAAAKAGLYTKFGGLLTRMSVQGLAEGSTHVANLLSQLTTGIGPTGNPLFNALLKSLGRVDLAVSLPKVLINAFADRKQDMLKLMQIGAAKQPYHGGVGWFITKIDHGVRLYSADVYKKMAAKGWVPDTDTGLREFVNQVGQYNKRLQPRWIQLLRSTHVQPFATAMQTFNVQSLRTMALSPGIKAASNAAAIALRAEKAAGILGFAVVVTSLNYLVSGSALGPPGTKLGAVGWIGDDKKLHQFDVGSLTGYNRGPRITGLQGFVEAKRLGLTTGTAIGAGAQGAFNAGLSAATGPANRFLFMAATGKRPSIPAVQEAPVAPPQEDDKLNVLKTQTAKNIIEAVKQSNPIVDATVRMMQGKYQEALTRQLSRYTPKTGMATETIAHLPKIVQAGELKNYTEALAKEARKLPRGSERNAFISQKLNDDGLSGALRSRAIEQLKMHGAYTH